MSFRDLGDLQCLLVCELFVNKLEEGRRVGKSPTTVVDRITAHAGREIRTQRGLDRLLYGAG